MQMEYAQRRVDERTVHANSLHHSGRCAMSSKERRKILAAEREVIDQARLAEQRRRDALNMWERIEELDVGEALKDVLHRLAQGEMEE
jgi:hypothetical protein